MQVIDHQGHYTDCRQQRLTASELMSSLYVQEHDMVVDTTMAYTMYIQDNLERIARDGWTPLSYEEFLTSEECRNITDPDLVKPIPSKDEGLEGWTLFGEVGVDAGMLMVTDPQYIGSQWEKSDSKNIAPSNIHKDGTVLYCALHGDAPTEDAIPFDHYAQVIGKYGKSMNDMQLAGEITEKKRYKGNAGHYSYQGCCDATLSEKQHGQLNFLAGHHGAGVVFSSGFGDGLYQVYGKIKDYGDWGERVSEVRIVMIGDSDDDEASTDSQVTEQEEVTADV